MTSSAKMLRLIVPLLFAVLLSGPAHAWTNENGQFDGLDFIGNTNLTQPNGDFLALCYETEEFRLFGFPISSTVKGYGLSSDRCATLDRALTTVQMETAQSFELIDPTLPSVAEDTVQRNLGNAAIWLVIAAVMVWIIIRRVKSLLGFEVRRPMRQKASDRILGVMCYVGSCDGIVESHEIAVICQTAQRLTRRTYKPADVIHITDHVDLNLSMQDFIDFGKGLRDAEKDTMMRAAFYVALASGRILPIEHTFLKNLAMGIGMPGEDFRRVMNIAFADLDLNPPQ